MVVVVVVKVHDVIIMIHIALIRRPPRRLPHPPTIVALIVSETGILNTLLVKLLFQSMVTDPPPPSLPLPHLPPPLLRCVLLYSMGTIVTHLPNPHRKNVAMMIAMMQIVIVVDRDVPRCAIHPGKKKITTKKKQRKKNSRSSFFFFSILSHVGALSFVDLKYKTHTHSAFVNVQIRTPSHNKNKTKKKRSSRYRNEKQEEDDKKSSRRSSAGEAPIEQESVYIEQDRKSEEAEKEDSGVWQAEEEEEYDETQTKSKHQEKPRSPSPSRSRRPSSRSPSPSRVR